MTIAQIKVLANELGYSISGNTKADLIQSFLEAQGEPDNQEEVLDDQDNSGNQDNQDNLDDQGNLGSQGE